MVVDLSPQIADVGIDNIGLHSKIILPNIL